MNQRSLIAIIILAGIGSIGSVLAYSGTISAGQGNFNNVLVTGACTGCGGGVQHIINYTGDGTTSKIITLSAIPTHMRICSISGSDAPMSILVDVDTSNHLFFAATDATTSFGGADQNSVSYSTIFPSNTSIDVAQLAIAIHGLPTFGNSNTSQYQIYLYN